MKTNNLKSVPTLAEQLANSNETTFDIAEGVFFEDVKLENIVSIQSNGVTGLNVTCKDGEVIFVSDKNHSSFEEILHLIGVPKKVRFYDDAYEECKKRYEGNDWIIYLWEDEEAQQKKETKVRKKQLLKFLTIATGDIYETRGRKHKYYFKNVVVDAKQERIIIKKVLKPNVYFAILGIGSFFNYQVFE